MNRIRELIRFYQAAGLNAAFGFGLYAILVALGLNMFVAQIVAHLLGAIFNYFTYSRYAFKSPETQKTRYIITYIVNYAISLLLLFIISKFLTSPYAAALLALVIASAINYLLLKHLVFITKRTV